MAKGFSSIDGRLLRSLRSVLLSPGALSAAHVRGRRRIFIGPLALFFVANALFVAVQALTDTNILSSPLDSHLYRQDWSPLARAMVEERLAAQGRSLADLTPLFDQAATFNAKTMMILMVLAVCPMLLLIFGTREQPSGAHVVFALHLYVFVLTLLSATVLLAHAELLLGGDGLRSRLVDHLLAALSLAILGAYTFVAIGRVYAATGWLRIVKTLALVSTVALLFLAYRFAVFAITLYTT